MFRLMFSSAVVEATSGDPTWRHLTALDYHYWTQPLPTWTAWYMNLLPSGFQKLSVAVMFAVEGLGAVPDRGATPAALLRGWCDRVPPAPDRRHRQLRLLQPALAIALCVPLLDDGFWPRAGAAISNAPRSPSRIAPAALARIVAIALFVTSLVPLAGAFRLRIAALEPLRVLYLGVEPFRVVNPYGLFQVMTTNRPEIVVEGSDDGRGLETLRVPLEGGRRAAAARVRGAAPAAARLADVVRRALELPRESWFLSFCHRLLDGSPPVLALLEHNPFPRAPPRFVRAIVYDYHFTDAATRRATGAWWRREPLGLYCPMLTLVNGELSAVGPPP